MKKVLTKVVWGGILSERLTRGHRNESKSEKKPSGSWTDFERDFEKVKDKLQKIQKNF